MLSNHHNRNNGGDNVMIKDNSNYFIQKNRGIA